MDEIFKNNTYRILELFIEFPTKDFSVRGIARELNLSHATILKYINDLQNLELIKKKKETLYPTYFADTQNQKYKFYKKNYLVLKLIDSGIIKHIQEETLPSSVILFGSGAKATFTEKSDIDIFVEAKESKFNIAKYEKKLNRKINLLFEPNLNNLSKELRNNIINGIVLYGFIKIQ
ncbi:MAG: nucleotidyltransferase domain-containing protein [Nanoarchaeota archaeon]|nr:nucleotidyltransferase domain-containing protein [Nanoarchaeota archaeon]MBU1632826.1 nucleotidyltransferase domain-containing protein [Nanoarchaeota archaeon]MBU1876481.1 nucleotidyltransferase domain-containing protein [Nanoarchaeota archaeon]